ncbi:MAG: hypothetical protein PHS54_00490 [Clostridia bacterium]|nr:hypothetical protein [Clostridia bacterium]
MSNNNSSDITSMFDSIKESLNSTQPSGDSSFRNFLKMEVGKTYLVRFVPNISDPKATFFHYSHHGFTSLSTGQYVDATCPRSFGERCPICELRFKLYKTKKEEDKNLAYMIRAHEKHLVNVYVVNDPTNSENEGNVKILRYGKRIQDKILQATEGDDADEFGPRVYDLTENGCNFKIKVETASEGTRKFTNYNNSRFTAASAIPNMSAEKMQEVYKNLFDLTKVLDIKSENELNMIIKEHILCEGGKISEERESSKNTKEERDSDEKPEIEKDAPSKKEVKKETSSASNATKAKIDNLLEGLDNL